VTEPAKVGFDVVRKTKVYEEVASQIERLIVEGALRPGDKLPSERELAERFNVSRSGVREGLRTVQRMGLVEARPGEGTIVRDLSIDTLLDPLASLLGRKRELIGELLDVRKIIEPPLAARAASHATAEDVARLSEILQRQKEKLERGELAIEEDSEFHYGIAQAARNTVILKVLDMLMDVLRESRERSLQVGGRPQKSFAGHRRILAAIKRRDVAAAQSAMAAHLQEIEDAILKKM
jgi:GntR family transcriptional repressor for pyruvate dehydrogenase complex